MSEDDDDDDDDTAADNNDAGRRLVAPNSLHSHLLNYLLNSYTYSWPSRGRRNDYTEN